MEKITNFVNLSLKIIENFVNRLQKNIVKCINQSSIKLAAGKKGTSLIGHRIKSYVYHNHRVYHINSKFVK